MVGAHDGEDKLPLEFSILFMLRLNVMWFVRGTVSIHADRNGRRCFGGCNTVHTVPSKSVVK